MFPKRDAEEGKYLEQGEEKDFYELKDNFIPLFDGTTPTTAPVAVGFLDALTNPETINTELDTSNLTEIDFDSNLSDYAGSTKAPGQHLSITLNLFSSNNSLSVEHPICLTFLVIITPIPLDLTEDCVNTLGYSIS